MTPLFDLETPPVWRWDISPPSRDAHHGTTTADVLIVGGGLAGVATAHHLAELRPDLDIVLVEALQVGLGATGASTGIVGPGLSAPLPALRRHYGDATTRAAFASTLAGVAAVRRLIDAEGIDCDARTERHVIGALTDGQLRRMRRHTAALSELGHPVRWWDAATTARRLGGGYRAAFSYDNVLLLNPFRLVDGLAAAAERRGVRIFERSRVTGLEHRLGAVVATTAGGTIVADRVLLAVDGYGGALNPHPSAVVPVRTHVVATAPLSERQRAELTWDGVGGVIDQRNFFDYYRLGAGGRLIFGGGPALHPTGDPHRDARASVRVFDTLESRLRRRFPMLTDVAVEARWSGLTGGTLDRLPVVGPVSDDGRVHFAGGWCGHGLSMCVDTARRYAATLAGVGDPGTLPWFRSRTAGLPSAALRSVALPGYLRAMDLQDRLSLATAGRPGAPVPVPMPARPSDRAAV